MTKEEGIGTVIAQRELVFARNNGDIENVFIRIGNPERHGSEGDYSCIYEIASDSHKTTHRTIGIDSMQALKLAISNLAPELKAWESNHNGKFQFLDEPGTGM